MGQNSTSLDYQQMRKRSRYLSPALFASIKWLALVKEFYEVNTAKMYPQVNADVFCVMLPYGNTIDTPITVVFEIRRGQLTPHLLTRTPVRLSDRGIVMKGTVYEWQTDYTKVPILACLPKGEPLDIRFFTEDLMVIGLHTLNRMQAGFEGNLNPAFTVYQETASKFAKLNASLVDSDILLDAPEGYAPVPVKSPVVSISFGVMPKPGPQFKMCLNCRRLIPLDANFCFQCGDRCSDPQNFRLSKIQLSLSDEMLAMSHVFALENWQKREFEKRVKAYFDQTIVPNFPRVYLLVSFTVKTLKSPSCVIDFTTITEGDRISSSCHYGEFPRHHLRPEIFFSANEGEWVRDLKRVEASVMCDPRHLPTVQELAQRFFQIYFQSLRDIAGV